MLSLKYHIKYLDNIFWTNFECIVDVLGITMSYGHLMDIRRTLKWDILRIFLGIA